jgi:hypothetical protein
MTIETTSILTGVAVVLVAAAIVAVVKHINNNQKHPCKKDIVFSDVCEPKMKQVTDCIESEIADRKEAYRELRNDMKEGFGEIKELIRKGQN